MSLPTQAQVNTAARYASVIAATMFGLLNLQALGVTLDQIKAVIEALGSTVNSILTLLSAAAALYAAYKGVKGSSPTGQAASIGANTSTVVAAGPNGSAVVTIKDPAMASAAIAADKKAA